MTPLAPPSLTAAALKNWIKRESPDVVLNPLNGIKSMLEKSGFDIPVAGRG